MIVHDYHFDAKFTDSLAGIVHDGVDGYSCLRVYLRYSSNNQPRTILQLFTEAVSMYGLYYTQLRLW